MIDSRRAFLKTAGVAAGAAALPGWSLELEAAEAAKLDKAGLADDYRRMYDDYRDTGLLKQDTLRRVSAATGTRYLVQLKLQGFDQGGKERFGVLGLRIVETKYAHVRLFLQIWDSSDGSIAWEGMQEMRISQETVTEEPVMQRMVLERTARDMVARLP